MISVIIPFKNSIKWLVRCVESCKWQVSDEIEFVFVADSGITDESDKYIREIADQKRFRLFYNEENAGVSGARNTGLKYARGEWITFLDSDDQLCLDFVGKFRVLQRTYGEDRNIYQFNHLRLYEPENGRKFIKAKMVNKEGLYDSRNGYSELPNAWCMVWNKVYKASFLKEHNILFNEYMKYGEDEIFNLDCLMYDPIICHAREKAYGVTKFFTNKQSLSKTRTARDLWFLETVLRLRIDFSDDPNWRRLICEVISEHWSSPTFKDIIGGKSDD